MAHPPPISVLALAIALAVAAPATAAEPVGAASFNVTAAIDLKALSQPTFVALVEPAAEAETAGPLVFYDFADTLCDLLTAEAARTVVPFHRNQTVIAYDSAAVAAPPETLA